MVSGNQTDMMVNGKGKFLPYSLPSVGPGADPSVHAVSSRVLGGRGTWV